MMTPWLLFLYTGAVAAGLVVALFLAAALFCLLFWIVAKYL